MVPGSSIGSDRDRRGPVDDDHPTEHDDDHPSAGHDHDHASPSHNDDDHGRSDYHHDDRRPASVDDHHVNAVGRHGGLAATDPLAAVGASRQRNRTEKCQDGAGGVMTRTES